MTWLSYNLQSLLRSAIRRPRTWIAGFLIAFVVLGAQMGRLKAVIAIDDLIDESFQATQDLRNLKKTFHVGENAFIAFRPRGPEDLCRIRAWISRSTLEVPGLSKAFSLFSLRRARAHDGKLWYPELIPLDCDEPHAVDFGVVDRSPWRLIVSDRALKDVGVELGFSRDFDLSSVKKLMDSAPTGIPSSWVGTAVWQHFMMDGLAKTSILNLAVLILLCVALRLTYGTWRSGALYVSTLILAGTLLYGAMGLAGTPIDVLDNSLFLMLAVSALEDFVFLSHTQLVRGSGWNIAFRRLLVPGFFTSVTTIVGFGSLCVSNLAIIRRFGFWAATGAGLEWAAVFLFLPAVMSVWPKFRVWTDPKRAIRPRALEWLAASRLPRPLVALMLLGYLGAAAALPRVTISDAPVRIFPPDHPFRQGVAYLKETRGWESDVSLLFPDFAKAAQNQAILASVRSLPGVVAMESPYSNLAFLKDGLPPLTAALVDREFSQTEIARRLVAPDGQARAVLYIADTDLREINKLVKRVRALCPLGECALGGDLIAYAEFANRVPETLLESLVVSLLLVGLLLAALAIAVGQLGKLPQLLIASFWGPAVMLVVLVLFDVRVNFLTCIFASVLVGLTGDNAIQFLLASSKRKGLEEGLGARAGGSIQCSAIMALAALVFLGSVFEPPRIFGALLFGGLLAALIGDIWLLRGLLGNKR